MNVVLAKAGTHTELPRSAMHGTDSRFHGTDIDLVRLLANYAKLDNCRTLLPQIFDYVQAGPGAVGYIRQASVIDINVIGLNYRL